MNSRAPRPSPGAGVEALEAALEEKRGNLLEEWEALGTVRRAKAQRVSDDGSDRARSLASRGVGWSEPGTTVTFEEECVCSDIELADDYEYSAYNDACDEYDELGPYYDYEDEDALRDGGGYEGRRTSTAACTRTTRRVRAAVDDTRHGHAAR